MLHILDGESSAGTLAQTAVPGQKVAWREVLIAGPTPSGLSRIEWRKVRAQHLSDHYGIDRRQCEMELLAQEELLDSCNAHEEVVLWFEHDLFCQANLLYVLNWFARKEPGSAKLSLVAIDRFPGIEDFRGLGQLSASQLASLFEQRKEVTKAQFATAVAGWIAYCSKDPTEIEEFLTLDSVSLPFLRRAMELHLARFPSVRNGLGRVEKTGLELIAAGFTRFGDLFSQFGSVEPVYGLGDIQFWLELKRMSDVRTPLVRLMSDGADQQLSSERLRDIEFEITDTGQRVLNDEADFIELNGIDLWIGGVHLQRGNIWRRDEEVKRLVRETT